MPDRELLYFLVCDFARVEDKTRKGIFIGAYGTNILAQGFPAALPSLAFVACFKGLAPKEKLGVTIKIPGVDEHLSTTQNVDTDQRSA